VLVGAGELELEAVGDVDDDPEGALEAGELGVAERDRVPEQGQALLVDDAADDRLAGPLQQRGEVELGGCGRPGR